MEAKAKAMVSQLYRQRPGSSLKTVYTLDLKYYGTNLLPVDLNPASQGATQKSCKTKKISNIEQGIMNVEGRNVANLILKGV